MNTQFNKQHDFCERVVSNESFVLVESKKLSEEWLTLPLSWFGTWSKGIIRYSHEYGRWKMEDGRWSDSGMMKMNSQMFKRRKNIIWFKGIWMLWKNSSRLLLKNSKGSDMYVENEIYIELDQPYK